MKLQEIIKTLETREKLIKNIKITINKNNIELTNIIKKLSSNNKLIKNLELINPYSVLSKGDMNLIDNTIKEDFPLLERQKILFEENSILNKKYLELINNNFNNDWQGGKYPGKVIETEDGYRLRFDDQSRSFKFQNYVNTKTTIICEDKEDAYKKANEYLYNYYKEKNGISNRYKFLTPDVIEVEATKGITFITDAKHLQKVIDNSISVKEDKKCNRFYILYLSGYRTHNLFGDLISKYNKYTYKNGCERDLRESNLINNDNAFFEEPEQKENEVLNKDGYPMNKWILGKFTGTIFQRAGENKWTIVVKKEDGSAVTKTLPFTDDNKEEVHKKAIEIRNALSDANDLTRNKIRIISNDVIEVKLTKGQIMKTDYKFLNLIEKHSVFATKSERESSKYYACLEINTIMTKYHKHITGYEMVDHIDRDPLNNCLSNLREADYKLNNNNRSKSDAYNTPILGVSYSARDNAWRARIKQDGKEFSTNFNISKFGFEEAKQMAIKTREEYNKKFLCNNG
jgi:hypothetical protein